MPPDVVQVAGRGSGSEGAARHQQRAEQCRDVRRGRDPQLPPSPLHHRLLRRSRQPGVPLSLPGMRHQ